MSDSNIASETESNAPSQSDATFKTVKLRRNYEEIVSQIRSEIAAGNLRIGDRLPNERDMAQVFGVSRTGVREAVRVLEMSGLVSVRVGVSGGIFIAGGDAAVVTRGLSDLALIGHLSPAALLETRILMTSEAVRLAAERATDEDFDRLDSDTDDIEHLTQIDDREQRTTRIVDFYRILGQATHNEVFALLIDSLTELVQARLNLVMHGPLESVIPARRRIIQHLRNRDADEAVKELVAHFKRLEAFLIEGEGHSDRSESAERS